MRTFVLGATGDIGGAVADRLAGAGHDVLALARSEAAETALAARGLEAVRGDLRAPEAWADLAGEVDALVHAAGVLGPEMAEIDRRLLDRLLVVAKARARPLRLLYTGGCWLYGDTGGSVATEASPYRPIPAFRYMTDAIARLATAPGIDALVVHPAMVYAADAGVLARYVAAARAGRRAEVWGDARARWPLVHRDDLADAYLRVLERSPPGETYIAAAEPGVAAFEIAARIQRRFGLDAAPKLRDVEDAVREHGPWAYGPALDQRLSGAKLMHRLGWRPAHVDLLAEIGAEAA